VIPTPGVALLVRELSCMGGVVISASHNPPEYNGIKLFDSRGLKLPDALEDEIEAFLAAGGLEGRAAASGEGGEGSKGSVGVNSRLSAVPEAKPSGAAENEAGIRDAEGVASDTFADGSCGAPASDTFAMPTGGAVGCVCDVDNACEIYIAHAVSSIEAQGVRFDGLRVALDAGHGAAALTSQAALERLGAQVVAINCDYDGTDINVECGSTHLGPLEQLMRESGADVGIAHDGDADRVMLMAPDGTVLDGDVVEAVCAIDMKRRGVLAGNTAVSTVMCNLGFVHAMRSAGIDVVQTRVGDRYVLEEMLEHGYSIGGEQSGHMILLDHNTTGDGLMTAVQFLAAVKRSGQTVAEAARTVVKYPQELINVRVADKAAVAQSPAVQAAVEAAEAALGTDGRVLLRPSGTEPVVRVMVEAATHKAALEHARAIAQVVSSC
jgi:phosphoglucosamine mutase